MRTLPLDVFRCSICLYPNQTYFQRIRISGNSSSRYDYNSNAPAAPSLPPPSLQKNKPDPTRIFLGFVGQHPFDSFPQNVLKPLNQDTVPMQQDLVRFPADVLIRFQHRSNDGIPDRRPIVLFISNYRSSCPNRDSSRPLQGLQEQGTKTTFLLMPIWTLTMLCIRHREDVFVHRLMRWILSFAIATNRISVVGAKPEPVPDVNGARFVKEAAVPVRVVRDVDKAGILEDIFQDRLGTEQPEGGSSPRHQGLFVRRD